MAGNRTLCCFMRNVLARVPKGQGEMVAAAIRASSPNPKAPWSHRPLGPGLGRDHRADARALLPAVATMSRDAREEITAFADFPEAHWRKVRSTNPLSSG